MQFFEPQELEEFYASSFDNISPTDTPLSEYVCGEETTPCQSCGSELDVRCQGFDGSYADGFVEIAYCEVCELEHRRTRTPVSDHIDYEYGQYRTDEREEYVCSDCHERHPITRPNGDFEVVETPQVQSFEQVTVPCPCGTPINIRGVEFSSEVSCSNCSRVYSFGLQNE